MMPRHWWSAGARFSNSTDQLQEVADSRRPEEDNEKDEDGKCKRESANTTTGENRSTTGAGGGERGPIISREAAFVAAFEQTNDEDILPPPQQSKLNQSTTTTTVSILPENATSPTPPFESFLAAVFSTFLAILLAWRFLAWQSNAVRVEKTSLEEFGEEEEENSHRDSVSLGPPSEPIQTFGNANYSSKRSTTTATTATKKRRPFDESVAPKRRTPPPTTGESLLKKYDDDDEILLTDPLVTTKDGQTTAAGQQGLVVVLSPPPSLSLFELEQVRYGDNSNNEAEANYYEYYEDAASSRASHHVHNNNAPSAAAAVVAVAEDWSTTGDEDDQQQEDDFNMTTTTTTTADITHVTMDPNFRQNHHRHHSQPQSSSLLGRHSTREEMMILAPSSSSSSSSAVISTPSWSSSNTTSATTQLQVSSYPYYTTRTTTCPTTVRRPLVSPPPPPITAVEVPASSLWSQTNIRMSQGGEWEDDFDAAPTAAFEDDDFLGSQLPPGFEIDQEQVEHEEEVEFPARQPAQTIVRDLDTITEVSETDDLSTSSSNGAKSEESWSAGELDHSGDYRRASTVNATGSSSSGSEGTVNHDGGDDEEIYAAAATTPRPFSERCHTTTAAGTGSGSGSSFSSPSAAAGISSRTNIDHVSSGSIPAVEIRRGGGPADHDADEEKDSCYHHHVGAPQVGDTTSREAACLPAADEIGDQQKSHQRLGDNGKNRSTVVGAEENDDDEDHFVALQSCASIAIGAETAGLGDVFAGTIQASCAERYDSSEVANFEHSFSTSTTTTTNSDDSGRTSVAGTDIPNDEHPPPATTTTKNYYNFQNPSCSSSSSSDSSSSSISDDFAFASSAAAVVDSPSRMAAAAADVSDGRSRRRRRRSPAAVSLNCTSTTTKRRSNEEEAAEGTEEDAAFLTPSSADIVQNRSIEETSSPPCRTSPRDRNNFTLPCITPDDNNATKQPYNSTCSGTITNADADQVCVVVGSLEQVGNYCQPSRQLQLSSSPSADAAEEEVDGPTPPREHRLLEAYQKYHNLKNTKQANGGAVDDISDNNTSSSVVTVYSAASSNSSEEPTALLIKRQNTCANNNFSSSSSTAAEGAVKGKEHEQGGESVEEEEEDDTISDPSYRMDRIDLQKALERFARYGELYGDAPRSGMEEFGGKNLADDSMDASTYDVASRMSSLPSSGSAAAKMEALLKSTLLTKGSTSPYCGGTAAAASRNNSGGVLSTATTPSLAGKRRGSDDDEILVSTNGGGGAGTTTLSGVNGRADQSTTTTTGYNNGISNSHQEGGSRRAKLPSEEENGTPILLVDTGTSNKTTKATSSSSSYGGEKGRFTTAGTSSNTNVEEKFLLQQRRSELHEQEEKDNKKNRYFTASPLSFAPRSSGASVPVPVVVGGGSFTSNTPTPTLLIGGANTTTAAESMNIGGGGGGGVYVPKSADDSNPRGILRPTSAPLTPLLEQPPSRSVSAYDYQHHHHHHHSRIESSSIGPAGGGGGELLCLASATSQAIINDPAADSTTIAGSPSSNRSRSRNRNKIIAEASANAVASNPYIALARATTAAASKAAQASSENLLHDGDVDGGGAGTVSLVVSSTVTTTKRDFFSTTKSNPDLVFFASKSDVSGLGLDSRRERRREYDVDDYEYQQHRYEDDRENMSYARERQQQRQQPVEVTPSYGKIPRGTASVFQQRHRELSPGGRSPERKRQDFGYHHHHEQQERSAGSVGRPAGTTTASRNQKDSKKALFASTDHLQKLLADPSYVKAEEQQQKPQPAARRVPPKPDVIPRGPTSQPPPATYKPAPLIERNVINWNRMPENSLMNQKQQNLLRWRNSMNLTENEELRQAMLEDQQRNMRRSATTTAATTTAAKPQIPLTEESIMEGGGSSYYGGGGGRESKRPTSALDIGTTPVVELWDYKIFREEQKRAESEVDEETRKHRRNKYKAKIDRAKKEYLSSKASASDLYRSIEDFEKKFNISMENVRLPDPPRGPYLEYLSRSGNLHVLDPSEVPPPAYVRPRPRFDREYESIVRNAEERWSAYRRRLHAAANKYGDDMYAARSRAYSTGFLETNIDDDDDEAPRGPGQKSIVETDLDKVQRQIDHDSRQRSKMPGGAGTVTNGHHHPAASSRPHNRAKSADFLMDQRARTEIEPPENQLQKILGDKDEKDLSEHELRFRKSTEKLQIPDWYLNSEYSAPGGGREPPEDRPRSRLYSYDRPKSTQSHYSRGTAADATSPRSYRKSRTTTPVRFQDDLLTDASSSRYVSPGVGGRISGPRGGGGGGAKTPEPAQRGSSRGGGARVESPSPKFTPRKVTDSPPKPTARNVKQPQPVRPEPGKIIEQHETREYHHRMTTTTTTSKSIIGQPIGIPPSASMTTQQQTKQNFVLPKHFFDKYKDEIEDMRKSRTALDSIQPIDDFDDEFYIDEQRRKRLSSQGLPLPVATVRPNQLHETEFDTTTSTNFSPTSSPEVRLGGGSKLGDHHYRIPPMAQHPPSRTQPTPTPRSALASGVAPSYRDDGPLNASTPYSSEQLPRRQTPSVVGGRETVFEPYYYHQQKQQQLQQDQPPAYPAPQPPPPQPPTGLQQQHQGGGVVRQSSFRSQETRHMPGGWTISAVPPDWNVPGQRDSVVIEVAGDALFDSGSGDAGSKGRRNQSNLTLEEVLDSMFALPVPNSKNILSTIDESSNSLLDDSLAMRPRTPTNLEGPGIFTQNQDLMDKCTEEPEVATELLRRETLWVKCGYCSKTSKLEEARHRGFVSCHHCYTYYCNRICRRCDWSRHVDICSYARINTLCKQVILKVRQDVESQFQMSRVAQRGYQNRGRGSVNFRFTNVNSAKNYVKDQPGAGWRSLRCPPNDPAEFLHYYTVQDLVDAKKDPSLTNLCRRYDPRSKFVLSVSIMADIEDCPETPPPEAADHQQQQQDSINQNQQQQSWYGRGIGGGPVTKSAGGGRNAAFSGSEFAWMNDARKHHTNGFSKDDNAIYDYQPPTDHDQQGQSSYFVRGDQHRHTVAATTPRSNRGGHWADTSSTSQQQQPGRLIGPEDADETEV